MTDSQPGPQLLGRYELIYLLGQGGMGEVHLARIRGAAGFEKLCIVKTILADRGSDPQFVDRFHHEAKLLVQLTHSSIAQVYDMGDAEGRLFMAIEYVAGVDLARVEGRAWQVGSQIPVPIALTVGQKIAEALGYAHRKIGPDGAPLGIVHRDVSPQNAMVSYEGEIKVIDFGLAKSAARSKQTLPSTVLGKLGYMSPEQARGERVDHRTDIYSCGVVVWEMLAGRPLFEMGTMGEMMGRMANPQVPSLPAIRPEVSPELDRAVARALAAAPADRYARADDFARALNEQAVRGGLATGAEEIGGYVRGLCVEEFAEQRKLMSRLSTLGRPVTPAPAMTGLEGTAIRTPAPPATDAAALLPRVTSAPHASAPVTAVPSPPVPGSTGNAKWAGLALVVLLLVVGGVYAGAHLKEWTAPVLPVAAAPVPVPVPAAVPVPAPAPAPSPAVADEAPAPTHKTKSPKAHGHAKPVAVAEAQPAPAPPPPEPVPAAAPVPAPAAAPKPPPQIRALSGHAKKSGFGPTRGITLYNDGEFGWRHCDLRLPDNRHYFLDALSPHDEEHVAMFRFKQDGTPHDVEVDSIVVHCEEGAVKLPL